MVDYQFRRLSMPRGTSRSQARQVLIDEAERGGWELDRVLLYPDGSRKVLLRRKVLRVARTM